MKKARFIAIDKQQQAFAVTLRNKVNAYFKEKGISTKGNGEVAAQTSVMLGLYLVPFVLSLVLPMPWWLAGIMAIVSGAGLAGIGMCVMHGAAHDSFSNRPWVNKLFGGTMNLLGNSLFTWKVQHNMLHHTYTNIDGLDRDIETKGPIRLSEFQPLRWYHRFQYIHAFFGYSFMTLSMLIKDFVQLNDYRKQGITAKQQVAFGPALAKMIGIKVLHIFVFIVLPILVTDHSWWLCILGWLAMHMTAGIIMSVVFQLAHVVEGVEQHALAEDGVINQDWAVHELRTTANFARNSRLLSWYVGGLNFQIEHHLFPHICHVHYPKIAPIVEETAKEWGVPYIVKPTLWAAIASHVRKLRDLGRIEPVMA